MDLHACMNCLLVKRAEADSCCVGCGSRHLVSITGFAEIYNLKMLLEEKLDSSREVVSKIEHMVEKFNTSWENTWFDGSQFQLPPEDDLKELL